jgi:hypothetical protein
MGDRPITPDQRSEDLKIRRPNPGTSARPSQRARYAGVLCRRAVGPVWPVDRADGRL